MRIGGEGSFGAKGHGWRWVGLGSVRMAEFGVDGWVNPFPSSPACVRVKTDVI